MPQHKKLSQLVLRLPEPPSNIDPATAQYLRSYTDALQRHFNTISAIDLCSGLTKFSDTVNAGYYMGFTRNDDGYDDGVPVLVVGDRGAEKYFEFDGDDVRIGASTQFQGADAYNNETTYYHTFFDSLDGINTSGSPSLDVATGALQINASDIAYRVAQETIGAFSFDSGKVRVKLSALMDPVTGVADGVHTYVMTGSRIGTNSGFGFVAKGTGGGLKWYGVSNLAGVETLTTESLTASVGGEILEAVLTANEMIEFYVDGSKFAEITTGLPTDGAGKGVQSQRCLYYIEASAIASTLKVGELRLLHERNS